MIRFYDQEKLLGGSPNSAGWCCKQKLQEVVRLSDFGKMDHARTELWKGWLEVKPTCDMCPPFAEDFGILNEYHHVHGGAGHMTRLNSKENSCLQTFVSARGSAVEIRVSCSFLRLSSFKQNLRNPFSVTPIFALLPRINSTSCLDTSSCSWSQRCCGHLCRDVKSASWV